jgi:hypothetical protein
MGSRSISEAICTGFGRLIATTQKVAADCIGMRGLLHSVQSLLGVTSTIGTATFQTTGLRTWSALTLRSTHEFLARPDRCTGKAESATWREKEPQSGIDLQRGESGTSGTPSALNRGQSGSANRNAARSARWSSKLSFVRAGMLRFIAALHVRLQPTASVESKPNGKLRIASVKRLSEKADVWDITVPDGHWFSLENGAVVHNCDAFGLMAVVYEQPQPNAPKQLTYPKRMTA